MFQGLGNLAGLMKNAQQLQGRAQEMKERLAATRVEATAGGGMVRVEASGDQKIVSLTIEPSLLEAGDKELIEDLVLLAVNQALDGAREAAAGEMSTLVEGLGLPGLPGLNEALSRFGLGS